MLESFAPQIVNINPLVLTIDGFLSDAECDGLIGAAQGRLYRATTDDADERGNVSVQRTNDHCSATPQEVPESFPILMKLGMILRIPFQHAEGPMILHYTQAEEFKPHSDGLPLDGSGRNTAEFERRGGQRLFSTLMYLNDVEQGGGTGFPELGLSIPPKRGRLLVFANTMAGSRELARLSVHAGEPVTAGEKWAAIAWWRERPRADAT